MTKKAKTNEGTIVIKKYANRRLYNTDTSTYVTLDDLAMMVREEQDFVVYDAKSREDLTHSVLTQIIVEQESKGQNLLPIRFLRQLIRFYGDSFEKFVPSYLELSMENLTQQQEKFQGNMADAFSGNAFEAMQEQTRQNMAMFEQAMSMFAPYGGPGGVAGATPNAPAPETKSNGNGSAPRATKKAAPKKSSASELDELKAQLSAVQSKLEELTDK